ncbi:MULTISPECIES: Rid family detoxifying hydrolase [unclassified Labrenzia]|jgi:2-iminobutanoate/2-iminopropanoate deaminase|uniref:RidA family protein n=1 Tax=unclassified Labrenzia TaxID=2648686 RepID=UPI0004BC2D62|nr:MULTISPECIES: Rid family detoxifying hydrolase [unclassified Labrenzia]
MSRTVIAPPSLTAPGVPLSPGIALENLVFVSGQLPVDTETGSFPEGVAAQTKASLANLKTVLEAAGASMGGVVKTTVFLKDMNDFAAMNAVYAEAFPSEPPARSAIEVARLPKDALVEIEAVAIRTR